MKVSELKCFLVSILCLFFVWGGISFSASGPDIHFDESEHDFGTIGQKEEHTYIFKFRNLGSDTLSIENVRTSCGCTAALISSKEVPAKGSGELKVVFDSGEFEDEVLKTIYIHSNDPDEPIAKVQIKANIKSIITVKPRLIYFGRIRKGDSSIKTAVISLNEEGLKITKVESLSKHLTARLIEFQEGDSNAGKGTEVASKKNKFTLEVTLGLVNELGRLYMGINLHTNSAKMPEKYVSVQVEIVGDVSLEPETVSFGIIQRGSLTHRNIIVNNAGKKILEISKVESSVEWLSTEMSTLEEGRKYMITLKLMPNVPSGSSKGNITIHTNDAEQPILIASVFANVTD